jgi:cell division protease FtsH
MKPDSRPKQSERSEPPKRHPETVLWLLLIAILGAWALQAIVSLSNPSPPVPYSQFQSWVDAGKVDKVMVRLDSIDGELKAPAADEPPRFTTSRVDPELADRLIQKGVTVSGAAAESWLGALLAWVLPLVLIYLFTSYLFRRAGGGALASYLSVGKSKARLYVETATRVTFADVAGVDEAKQELTEVVAFLKDPASFGRLGARAPKGTLLIGPPGTGKTLLARAVAGEAGVPFFSISGSEFVEMFVGVGAARVRDLFEQARQSAPSIIFIDELDALGRSRSDIAFGGYDEKEQTLNQLLSEIDGFDPAAGVILLAATNRPEILDKALLRAGRFDRQVMVDKPDRKGRVDILKVHIRRVTADATLDLDTIAGLTTGFAGADLANLVNEAAIVATRRKGGAVTLADFEAAIERVVAGAEKRNRIMRPEERRRVAYHEIGHALVAASLPTPDPVQKVSIIPRGMGALGFTLQRPVEDRYLVARSELEEQMAVLLGGRAAEALVYQDDVSNGASDDLDRATQIATDMIIRFGMDRIVGERTFRHRAEPLLLGGGPAIVGAEETQREIDVAVRETIADASARAQAILTMRRTLLDAGADLLLKREALTPEEFPALKKQVLATARELTTSERQSFESG